MVTRSRAPSREEPYPTTEGSAPFEGGRAAVAGARSLACRDRAMAFAGPWCFLAPLSLAACSVSLQGPGRRSPVGRSPALG